MLVKKEKVSSKYNKKCEQNSKLEVNQKVFKKNPKNVNKKKIINI